ncbi:MAG: DUF4317 domain-containing protein [Eubacteriales bacterium]|nr:DUF4317 domain-containing protein [Eubacteriales bacterium]
MNQRDLSEIRRRLNPDRRNPTVLRGCYVAADGHIISTFAQPVFHLPQEENEKYMAIFRRTLSGMPGQNLLEVEFSASQVMNGEEHHLLTALRESDLTDEQAVNAFYQRVIESRARPEAPVETHDEGEAALPEAQAEMAPAPADDQGNYLILLLHDGYDVPFRNQNGEADLEQSNNVFHYILCAVCPVKQTKPTLSYYAAESEFHNRASDWVVGPPDLGFLFPAYEERGANLYRTLYYTRDVADAHEAFVQGVFGAELFMPAQEQKQTFQAVLQEALADECSLDVVQAVHESVCERIEAQKADKTAEPLRLTRQDVREVLQSSGVSQERAAAFEEKYAEAFGAYAELPAVNMVAPKEFKVDTPSVSIRVDPAHSDLIETRVIDGRYYILVLADGDVEVNGVSVKLK